MNQIVLTKQIAKHGKQSIIILPAFLRDTLRPKTIVKVTIDVLEEAKDD